LLVLLLRDTFIFFNSTVIFEYASVKFFRNSQNQTGVLKFFPRLDSQFSHFSLI